MAHFSTLKMEAVCSSKKVGELQLDYTVVQFQKVIFLILATVRTSDSNKINPN
jgi:hypothetical protein